MSHSTLSASASALLITALATALVACAEKSDAEYRAEIMTAIHDSINADLDEFVQATRNLQAASPSLAWRAAEDATAITTMQAAWKRMRTAYEHVECTLVAVFPGTEATMNARYEDALAALGGAGDQDLFDARGVTGMHGIERILYAPTIRPEVIAFERTLPGYQPASYPVTDDEAISFKTVLVQLLIDRATTLRKQWQPIVIDVGGAYRDMVGLMNEQKDKVNRAATDVEESRYANLTLFDLRNYLDGSQKIYNLFRDWIRSKDDGARSDALLQRKFDELAALYATITSDALPTPPDDWSSDQPTADNLATPFGELWRRVHASADPHSDGSVIALMNQIATLLGVPEYVGP